MDQDDKEELADFMLGFDQAGEGYLNKTLNDPDSLTRMAWFALKGPQVFNEIQDYYNNQITQVRQQAYQQGFDFVKNNRQPNHHHHRQQLIGDERTAQLVHNQSTSNSTR